jgi:Uncharacterised nucleotidyltransferase
MHPSLVPDDTAGAPAVSLSPDSSESHSSKPERHWPGLPPGVEPRVEIELILCCARTEVDETRSRRIRFLASQSLNWESVLRTAHLHGMMALLHRHLNALVPEAVPPEILGRLRARFDENTRRNLFLTGELLRVLDQARAHGLPLAAFKGPALTLMAYGHLGLREFCDLDILARPEDVPRVGEVLMSRGYRPEVLPDSAQGIVYRRFESRLLFHRQDPDATIELHWQLTPGYISFPRDRRVVWGELATVAMGNQRIPALSPEAMLLFLAVHGAKHHWESLGWICDLVCLIENVAPLDWGRIMQRAGEEHCRRMLFVGLFLARDLLGVALPPQVERQMKDDQVASRMAGSVAGRFLRSDDRPERPIDHGAFLLRCFERTRDRVRFCLELAFRPNSGDLSALPIPGPLAPMYCLVRPIRLAWRYGPRLFRRDGGPPTRGPASARGTFEGES